MDKKVGHNKISTDKTKNLVYNYGKLPSNDIPKLKIGNKTTEYKNILNYKDGIR